MALSMKRAVGDDELVDLVAHAPRSSAVGTTTAISSTVSAARSASTTHSTIGLPATGTSPLNVHGGVDDRAVAAGRAPPRRPSRVPLLGPGHGHAVAARSRSPRPTSRCSAALRGDARGRLAVARTPRRRGAAACDRRAENPGCARTPMLALRRPRVPARSPTTGRGCWRASARRRTSPQLQGGDERRGVAEPARAAASNARYAVGRRTPARRA